MVKIQTTYFVSRGGGGVVLSLYMFPLCKTMTMRTLLKPMTVILPRSSKMVVPVCCDLRT